MSWLMAKLYDRVMAPAEEAGLARWREELLQRASGRVLDVGSGTGANAEHYPRHVESVTFLEPDRHMREQLEEHVRSKEWPWDYRIVDSAAEELPFGDDTFDTATVMLVLCTVEQPARALRELRRVLTPDGELLFLEHVAAEEGSRRRLLQRVVNPVWKRVAGNCHVTRTTEKTLVDAGFDIAEVERESMRKAPPFVRPTIRGRAFAGAPVRG